MTVPARSILSRPASGGSGETADSRAKATTAVLPMAARILTLLFALCLATAAKAVVPLVMWSAPGSVCVPADATIKFNRHKVGVVAVQHAPDNVELVTLNCPIAGSLAGGVTDWHRGLMYRDSSGTGPSAFIRARLYRLPAGDVTPVLMAEVNSNSFPIATGTVQQSGVFTHTFNFAANSYWIHVDLDRSLLTDVVVLYKVSLIGDSCGVC